MLCSPGSGGCLSEPQSLLCTGGVSPASPAFVPRGSSSSAQRSNPVRVGPIQFSLSGERCRGVAASGQLEGTLQSSCVALSGPPLALVVHLRRSFYICWGHHHHRHRLDLAFFLQTHLRRHRLCWDRYHRLFLLLHHCDHQLQASYVACPAGASCTTRGLLACSGPVCQLNTIAVRGIFVPVDFGHGDFLSMLLLEVVD